MLDVTRLTKYYGSKMAVEEIGFSLKRGEIVGLLGHNGSGKSTTMSMLTGCLSPTAGEVRVDGISLLAHPAAAKGKIGYLPETPPLYLDMTVREQLEFAAGLRGIPARAAAAAIDLACERLNILPVRGRLIGNLSKGYRQRVGFAQALVGEPPLLVLDEPTVGLDPRQIIELRQVIATLGKEHAILFSSHILSELATVCGRMIVLSGGRMVADDTPAKLIARVGTQGRTLLRADGPPETVLTALRGVDGVSGCEQTRDPADGVMQYFIEVQEGADCAPGVFAALAAAGCPIRLLKPAEANLEDVFLQLTRDTRYEEATQ